MLYFLIFFAIPLVLGLIASGLTHAAFSRYSRIATRYGYTGAQAAAEMLRRAGIHDVDIVVSQGFLSDHYNPLTRQLGLSPQVYYGNSLAAIGVACHEAGHAIQHATRYPFLWLRSALVPLVNIGSMLYSYVFLFGIIFHIGSFIMLGVIISALMCLFAFITLPVEWDASARAKEALIRQGFLAQDELYGASRVLNAAFLTYIAGFVSSALSLLYWLLRAGLIGGRSEE